MRYMQIIEAQDIHQARQSYLELLARQRIELVPSMAIYIETVHKSDPRVCSWLCYVGQAQHAAA